MSATVRIQAMPVGDQLRSTTASILALVLLIAPLGPRLVAQEPAPPEVRARIVEALQPDSGQRVEILRESRPRVFPGVVVFRGRRVPPPFAGAEDSRPRSASVIQRDSHTELVYELSQASRAWALMSPQPIEEPRRALRAVLSLLQMTGLVSRDQLLTSPSDARRKVARSSLREPAALGEVRAPKAEGTSGGVRVQFYASMPLGLYEYTVTIDASNYLSVDRRLLSGLVLQM